MARVLVVDDEKSVREVYRDTLLTGSRSAERHEVHLAADGAAARDMLSQGAWDVVVTDVIMPGEDGLDLLRWIRSRDPTTRVILVSGSPDPETAAEAGRLGAFDFLHKPVGCPALRRVVAQAGRLAARERSTEGPGAAPGAASAPPHPRGKM